MRCLGCLTNRTCRNCSTPEGVVDLHEEAPRIEAVRRYTGIEPDEEVLPPGVTIHSWRPTLEYQSPWDDPGWFADDAVSEDVRLLFATELGHLMQSSAAETPDHASILDRGLHDPEPRHVLLFDQKVASIIRDWRRYEVAYATMFLIAERDGISVSKPFAMALRRKLLACEVVLIGRHNLTMPGYDAGWSVLQRKEEFETRIAEIHDLDERIAEHR